MSAAIDFRIGHCPCPGTPHEEDHIYLEPALTMQMGVAAYLAMQDARKTGENVIGAQVASYFPRAIRAWTFLDEKGQLREITREAVDELVPWDRGGFALADKVSELYGKTLAIPLAVKPSPSLPDGPMASSTSPSPESGSVLPTPLRPSSPRRSAGRPSEVPAP